MKMTAVFMAVPEGYIFSQRKSRDELIIAASVVLVFLIPVNAILQADSWHLPESQKCDCGSR